MVFLVAWPVRLEYLEWASFLTTLGDSEAKLESVLQFLIVFVRHEPLSFSSLSDFSGLGKTLAGTLTSLAALADYGGQGEFKSTTASGSVGA
jgi:hypothetical protein